MKEPKVVLLALVSAVVVVAVQQIGFRDNPYVTIPVSFGIFAVAAAFFIRSVRRQEVSNR